MKADRPRVPSSRPPTDASKPKLALLVAWLMLGVLLVSAVWKTESDASPNAPDAITASGASQTTVVVEPEVADDTSTTTEVAPTTAVVDSIPRVLRVEGNQLIAPDGSDTRLIGVNRAGGEYACVQNLGVWDGPADAALVKAMVAWEVNSVRIPLNEHCWLGVDTENQFAGETYRKAIAEFVGLLNDRDIVAVLDLHWSGPGDGPAERNMPMPNADNSADFWRSVGTAFVDNPMVLFDLFNEPHNVDWECWSKGCIMSEGYVAVGMQTLVDAIRSTGATQPIIVSGINYANDLSRWLELAPKDHLNALMAGFHVYNFNECRTPACWDKTVASVAEVVPVVAAEVGEDTCQGLFSGDFLQWADENGISYLGWTFNAWDCQSGPALVSDDSGTPTPFGQAFLDHYLGQSN